MPTTTATPNHATNRDAMLACITSAVRRLWQSPKHELAQRARLNMPIMLMRESSASTTAVIEIAAIGRIQRTLKTYRNVYSDVARARFAYGVWLTLNTRDAITPDYNPHNDI